MSSIRFGSQVRSGPAVEEVEVVLPGRTVVAALPGALDRPAALAEFPGETLPEVVAFPFQFVLPLPI
jgi:hypothetical protein